MRSMTFMAVRLRVLSGGGGGVQKRTYFGGGQEKYSLQRGGAEFPIFLRTYFMDDP